MGKAWAALAVVSLVACGVLDVSAAASDTNTRAVASLSTPAPAVEAIDALGALKVKGRAPKTGYARSKFGAAWSDVDRNGCDTRNDILRRDLADTTLRTNGCVVLTGALTDPYGGSEIAFVRGVTTSSDVQIDHVVALGDAWVKGAQALTLTQRTKFANDPLNLLAVEGTLNEQKGAGDAATWLPPLKAYRCDYVSREIAVKRSYRLWVTVAEKKAMTNILSGCDGQTLPTRAEVQIPAVVPPETPPPMTPSPSPSDTSTPTPTPSASITVTPTTTPTASGDDPRFRTCAQAIAAGYGPYYRGQDPEYAWYRDADSDGVVCER